MEQQRFTCLNCQGNLRLDSVRRSEGTDDERSKYTEKENDSTESLQGQAKNLMKLICDAQCSSDAPVCGECSDELLVGMEKQLASLEEERASYQTFLDHLKATHSSSNISELKSTLQNLQDQEKSLENELEKLILEEKSIDEELQAKRKKNKASEQKSEHLWQTYRDNLRKLLEAEDTLRSVDSELRYADIQHRRLTDTNILDICFHIWVEGQIGEINGFRLGRLQEVPVDWTEINAAWGQVVLLLDILFERLGIKHPNLVPVPMGSHSFIKKTRNGIDAETYPLYGSGSHFAANTCVDNGIKEFLKLLQFLQRELKDRNPDFNAPFRIHTDRLIDNGVEYKAVMMLNVESRWTRAMSMMLIDLKVAIAQCISLRSPA